MATILAFPPPPPSGRASLRRRVERAIQDALDAASLLVAYLDQLDGDPDDEDEGTAEPAMAATINDGAQIRWVGFEGGAA